MLNIIQIFGIIYGNFLFCRGIFNTLSSNADVGRKADVLHGTGIWTVCWPGPAHHLGMFAFL